MSTDDPAAHYDRTTAAWRLLMGESFHYGLFHDPTEALDVATARLTDHMALRGSVAAGHHVLDVGCGVGAPATRLATTIGCSVLGISTSAVGISVAGGSGRTKKTTFQVADAQDNGLPPDSFDRVWVLESAHLMPQKDRMLAEGSRVLRPGGRLVLCDITRRAELPLALVLQHARAFNTLRRAFGRAKMESLAVFSAMAEQAGLVVHQTEDLTTEARPTLAAWRQRAERHAEAVDALIGAEARRDFHASCGLLETFFDEGLLGYGLLVADKPG